MTSTFNPQDLIGTEAVDPSGNKIGKVGTVYVTDEGRKPEWVTVKTGMLGNKESFVPLAGARTGENGLQVRPDKETVKGAPQISAEGHLDQNETDELYRYYGLRPDGSSGDAPSQGQGQGRQQGENAAGTAGAGTAGAAGAGGAAAGAAAGGGGRHEQPGRSSGTDAGAAAGSTGAGSDGDRAMLRSEERMSTGTERVESGRARLHKYVVTEEQQVTVPVSHEEVRVEREPISEADRGRADDGGIGEEEQEVVLHEERPVVQKETVPVEKVHLDTETVTEEQTVSGEIRKEQVEVDDPNEQRRGQR